ncbi:hypothetical protein M8J77_009980 [Diaphorina citri]|nr:hypothetical protein M8J77_009980 [Diaphorina citri]
MTKCKEKKKKKNKKKKKEEEEEEKKKKKKKKKKKEEEEEVLGRSEEGSFQFFNKIGEKMRENHPGIPERHNHCFGISGNKEQTSNNLNQMSISL